MPYQCLKCGRVYRYKRQVMDHLSCTHNAKISKLTPELFFVKF